jgi:hypothetical protein
MSKFPWGKVIDYITLDFDGVKCEITKYHPYKDFCRSKEIDTSKVEYHSEEMHQSTNTIYGMVIAFITYKQLGLNHHSLAGGICRALQIND